VKTSHSKKKIIDCDNFWSPSGGGVKRYHLEKINFFSKQQEVDYVFVMQDTTAYTEKVSESTTIEHIYAPKIPGNWEYRYAIWPTAITHVFKKHKPDIVEIGSPYTMPWLVRWAIWRNKLHTKTVYFWHADFPVTYIRYFFSKWSLLLARVLEWAAWTYARIAYGNAQKIFVSSPFIGQRMQKRGLSPIAHVPLGVDTQLFHPSKRDVKKVERIQAGNSNRLTVFFPHRFMEEKGVRTLLKTYPLLCQEMDVEPAIVFAGTGPELDAVKSAAKEYEHIHYLGYISNREEMASWFASCDLGLALSGYETFGLAILEAMSSGQIMIGASTGAAYEHIRESEAGITIPTGDVQALKHAFFQIAKEAKSSTCTMPEKARTYAQQFTWDACFQKEMVEYKKLF
jgi:alpha-1,6-mannosyltransferase